MENKLISQALICQHLLRDAKLMYLVGVNKSGDQTLITIRYRKSPIIVAQLCESEVQKDKTIRVFFSDISIIHTNETITGGVPTLDGFRAMFVYDRSTLKLKFFFDDPDQSCEIMMDTGMSFIELISRM